MDTKEEGLEIGKSHLCGKEITDNCQRNMFGARANKRYHFKKIINN